MNRFLTEVQHFLDNHSIPTDYKSIAGIDLLFCCVNKVIICPVEISSFTTLNPTVFLEKLKDIRRIFSEYEVIYLYQDKWITLEEIVRGRLLAQLNRGKSIFARNCVVKEIPQEQAANFLEKHHLYGATKAKYRYGLFRSRATGSNEIGMEHSSSLVAVATFSSGREIHNEGFSYEWERYASLNGYRIAGGMGKILNHFVRQRKSERKSFGVMSYCDLEWSEGEAYHKLGFSAYSYREPVKFLIDKESYKRTHFNKIGRDRAFPKELLDDSDNFTYIYNMGSIKFISRYE